MRVRMISGAKRVTVLSSARSSHTVKRNRNSVGATDKLKFVLIKPAGQVERGELHTPLGDIKRSSRRLRPIERKLRKLIRNEQKALGRYLVLHDKSRRRKKNGWVRDLGSNLAKVIRRRD